MPPAPPRLSTTNVCPSASVYFFARSREGMSVVPPGDAGTMIRTDLTGQACPELVEVVCACADTPAHDSTMTTAAAIDLMRSLRSCWTWQRRLHRVRADVQCRWGAHRRSQCLLQR